MSAASFPEALKDARLREAMERAGSRRAFIGAAWPAWINGWNEE